jgi:hypothetical protein
MMRKLPIWLGVAFAGGVLVAGCGSSSSTSTTQSTPTAATTSPTAAATTPTAASTSPTATTTTSSGPTRTPTVAKPTLSGGATAGTAAKQPSPPKQPSPLQSAAACKQEIQQQRTFSPSAKSKLEAICEKAAAGDPNALHRVAQEACVELVNAAHVPAAYRERALAYCKVK